MTIDRGQFIRAECGELCEDGLFGFDLGYRDSALVVVGVLWELTTSYRRGTGKAPPAIVRASQQIDLYDDMLPNSYRQGIHYQLFDEFADSRSLVDESCQSVNSVSKQFNEALYHKCQKIVADGKLLGL